MDPVPIDSTDFIIVISKVLVSVVSSAATPNRFRHCSLLSIYKNGKMNLREIAMREGISYARVKQIQDAALTKLKKRGFDLKQFLYD